MESLTALESRSVMVKLTGTTEDTDWPVVCTGVPQCQNIIEKHVLSTKSISNIKLEDKV